MTQDGVAPDMIPASHKSLSIEKIDSASKDGFQLCFELEVRISRRPRCKIDQKINVASCWIEICDPHGRPKYLDACNPMPPASVGEFVIFSEDHWVHCPSLPSASTGNWAKRPGGNFKAWYQQSIVGINEALKCFVT